MADRQVDTESETQTALNRRKAQYCQTNTQTDRQTDRKTDGHADRHTAEDKRTDIDKLLPLVLNKAVC